MQKNIKFIIFIILAIIALYFTRVNYGDHSKNKSPKMSKDEAEQYCKDEINKKISK